MTTRSIFQSVVNRATEHNHLGLVLTPKLNFEARLVDKMKKAKKIIGINKYLRLKFGEDVKVKTLSNGSIRYTIEDTP